MSIALHWVGFCVLSTWGEGDGDAGESYWARGTDVGEGFRGFAEFGVRVAVPSFFIYTIFNPWWGSVTIFEAGQTKVKESKKPAASIYRSISLTHSQPFKSFLGSLFLTWLHVLTKRVFLATMQSTAADTKPTSRPRSIRHVPDELVLMIVKNMTDYEYRHGDIQALVSLALCSRQMYRVVNPVLYDLAIVRHPYLIVYAAQTDNIGLLKRVIAAGADLNTIVAPAYIHSCRSLIDHPLDTRTARLDLFATRYAVGDDIITKRNNGNVFPGFYTKQVRAKKKEWEWINTAVGMHPLNAKIILSMASPLHAAVMRGNCEAIALLLDAGADIDLPCRGLCDCDFLKDNKLTQIKSELQKASREALHDSPREWLYVNEHYRRMWTALHLAVCFKREEAFWMLRSRGANGFFDLQNLKPTLGRNVFGFDLNRTYETSRKGDILGQTPFWLACRNNVDSALIDFLFENGADVEEDLGTGLTPLTYACIYGYWEMALRLVRNMGANANIVARELDWDLRVKPGEQFERRRLPVGLRLIDICAGFRLMDRFESAKLSEEGKPELAFRCKHLLEVSRVGIESAPVANTRDDAKDAVLEAALEHQMEAMEAIASTNQFTDYLARHGMEQIICTILDSTCRKCTTPGLRDYFHGRISFEVSNPEIHLDEFEQLMKSQGIGSDLPSEGVKVQRFS
ncbi:hypothetical protein QBC44DRAFT_310354 [Cladorrhinum sp. PSN332]|nr:hypothetical protein QBC44DRAFT_310354 [Cladorrhinum sp. PSN332]